MQCMDVSLIDKSSAVLEVKTVAHPVKIQRKLISTNIKPQNNKNKQNSKQAKDYLCIRRKNLRTLWNFLRF